MDSATELEIEWRKELLARLQAPLKVLQRKAGKDLEKRLARAQELSAYETEEEAHEAFGYGYITWDEYSVIKDRFDNVEPSIITMSAAEAALEELQDFMHRLQSEIKDLEWSALPEEEQQRIEASNEAFRANCKRAHNDREE